MPDHGPGPREVTGLLRTAFDEDVRPRPVDAPALVAGVRARVRRRRALRRARFAVAAAVVAVALPLGVRAWPGGSVTTVPSTASGGVTPDRPRPGPSAAPGPTTTASGVPSTAPPVQTPSPGELPELTRTLAAVPTGLEVISDQGAYEWDYTPLAGLGVTCASTPSTPRTLLARKWQWNAVDLGVDEQHGVSLTVTRWPAGAATTAFDALATGDAACRFDWAVTPLDVTVPGADQTWAATTDFDGTYQGGPVHQVSAAVRVGDLAVGLSVESSRPDREEELRDLLTAAVADLRAAEPTAG